MTEENKDILMETLIKAHNQAMKGKGRIRHNPKDLPFAEQKIMQFTRMIGIGGPVFQVNKKTTEAVDLQKAGMPDKAKAELLGAIVYAAAAYIYLEELEDESWT